MNWSLLSDKKDQKSVALLAFVTLGRLLVVGSIPDEVKKDSVAEEANIQPKWMVTHVKGARFHEDFLGF